MLVESLLIQINQKLQLLMPLLIILKLIKNLINYLLVQELQEVMEGLVLVPIDISLRNGLLMLVLTPQMEI